MRFLKTLIYKITGERNYLLIVSSLFFFFYNRGFLKLFNKFDTHYIAPALIRRGWVIIDIGANLGYYSVILAEATGKTGKLYAVEPISDYRAVLQRNIKTLPWVEIIPYALGDKNGTVRMAIPGSDKTRHGLTRITNRDNGKESEQNSSKDAGVSRESTSGGWDVEIRRPADLFGEIETVHYIKCDIEGYEAKLFPELMPLIKKSKPIIQVEISKENRNLIRGMIIPEGYSSFRAERGGMVPENAGEIKESDVIFIPDEKIGDYFELIDD